MFVCLMGHFFRLVARYMDIIAQNSTRVVLEKPQYVHW